MRLEENTSYFNLIPSAEKHKAKSTSEAEDSSFSMCCSVHKQEKLQNVSAITWCYFLLQYLILYPYCGELKDTVDFINWI